MRIKAQAFQTFLAFGLGFALLVARLLALFCFLAFGGLYILAAKLLFFLLLKICLLYNNLLGILEFPFDFRTPLS